MIYKILWGRGYIFHFWHDLLNGDTKLKDSYLERFLIARDKDARVTD